MSDYGFLVGPYFLGLTIVGVVLGLIAVWSGRATWLRLLAVGLLGIAIYLSFGAVDNLLSRPKPITFEELQSQIPEGHQGHLVLYGEVIAGGGIYLLLRSPAYSEPRYYVMAANEKLQENFHEAQREAKRKGTQLLLGGKPSKKGDGKDGKKGNKKGNGRERNAPPDPFHPAPVSGGPEKDMTTPDPPLRIPTPSRSPAFVPPPGRGDGGD